MSQVILEEILKDSRGQLNDRPLSKVVREEANDSIQQSAPD